MLVTELLEHLEAALVAWHREGKLPMLVRQIQATTVPYPLVRSLGRRVVLVRDPTRITRRRVLNFMKVQMGKVRYARSTGIQVTTRGTILLEQLLSHLFQELGPASIYSQRKV